MNWDPVESAKQHKGLSIRDGVYYWAQMIRGKRYHESLGVLVGTKSDERQALRVLKFKQSNVLMQRIESYEQTRIKRS
jgi:hypothetical protein